MMLRRLAVLLTLTCILALVLTEGTAEATGDHSYWNKVKSDKGDQKPDKKDNGKEDPYADLIEDKVKIEGLFTFYHDTVDNSMLMEIKPDHFGAIYLCGMSLSRGDGQFLEGCRMWGTFPFYFKRVGKNILMLEKNLRIRADSSTTMYS